MATIPCQRDRTHTGVWTCSCANGGNFCSLCILDHMGSDPPGQQHSVSPRESIGQYVCGICHGQPVDSIRFKYDVCLCNRCASSLTISRHAGEQIAPREIAGAEIPEVQMKQQSEVAQEREAKQRAEVPQGAPQEAELKRRAEGSRSMLQRMISEKRNDIHQSLRRAYDNMNSLEEIIQEALSLEVQLSESRLEVQRLQSRLAEQGGGSRAEAGQLAGIQAIMERIEGLIRENEALKTQNTSFGVQITELKTIMQSSEQPIAELQKQKAEAPVRLDDTQIQALLKRQLDEAIVILQDSFREQLADSTKVAAQKVTDVIPLVAHLELDNQWLDRESMEKFLQLATLGINDWIDSERMREVARVCVQVAKHLGPNRLIAVFADNVAKKLKTNKEEGLKLVRSLHSVYEKTRSDQSSKNVIEGLLSLLEVDIAAFNDCVNIVSHLGKLLNLRSVCEFSTEMTQFFAQHRPDSDEWKQCLLSLPVDWNQHRAAAEKCVKDLLDSVKERNFDRSYLPLAKLLNSGRIADPASLFELVSKLGTNMKSAAIAGQIRGLLGTIIEFVETALRSPQQEAKTKIETSFGTLKHLLKERDATPKEVQQLTLLLTTLTTNPALVTLASQLLKTLDILRNVETIAQLGFATLSWVFPGDQLRPKIDFALWLTNLLSQSDRGTIEDTAKKITVLLSRLSQIRGENIEQMVQKLVLKNVPFGKTCDLACVLISDFRLGADQLNFLITKLVDLADNAAQPVTTEWVEKTEAMVRSKSELLLKTFQFYGEMRRRKQPLADATDLGREFLTLFQASSDPRILTTLLDTALQILGTDNLQHVLVPRVCKFWSTGKRILPADSRPYTFSTFLLQSVASRNPAELDALLTELETTIGLGNGVFTTTVFTLADIYAECVNQRSVPTTRFFRKTLENLKNMQTLAQGSKTSLEALTQKTINQLRDSKESALLYLEGVYQLCQLNKAAIDTYLQNLNILLDRPETLLLLKTMSRLANFGYYLSILALSCQHQDAVVTNTQSKLVELAIYLEQRGIDVPELSQALSSAILRRAPEVEQLLMAVLTMLSKSNYFAYYRVAYQLLEELARRTKEVLPLLCFVSGITTALLDTGLTPQYVLKLHEVMMGGLDDAGSLAMMEKLRTEWKQDWVQRFVEMLNRQRERVTLRNVEELLPKPAPVPQPVVQPVAPPPAQADPQLLIDVQPSTIRLFNFQSNAWDNAVQLSSKIKVDGNSSWTFLDANRVFCCGDELKEAYMLTRANPNWTVAPLPNMITARYSHGIIYLADYDTVFVFGGSRGSTSYTAVYGTVHSAVGSTNYPAVKSEKFNLNRQPQAWEALTDMKQARCGFNPCLFQDVIYLCGSSVGNPATLEAYSPRANAYIPLNISLPENSNCCLYVDDNKLVVHSYKFILKYALNQANQLAEHSRTQAPAVGKYQNSQPIINRATRQVYMSVQGKCLVFSMDTGAQSANIA